MKTGNECEILLKSGPSASFYSDNGVIAVAIRTHRRKEATQRFSHTDPVKYMTKRTFVAAYKTVQLSTTNAQLYSNLVTLRPSKTLTAWVARHSALRLPHHTYK